MTYQFVNILVLSWGDLGYFGICRSTLTLNLTSHSRFFLNLGSFMRRPWLLEALVGDFLLYPRLDAVDESLARFLAEVVRLDQLGVPGLHNAGVPVDEVRHLGGRHPWVLLLKYNGLLVVRPWFPYF